MNVGEVVQVGTPEELFEEPHHTFVGHFIGSPGMNVLPCSIDNGAAVVAGQKVATANKLSKATGQTEVGVRPEHISFARQGLPVRVVKVSDAGRFSIVDTDSEAGRIRLLVNEDAEIPSESARLAFEAERTRIYVDGWLAGREGKP